MTRPATRQAHARLWRMVEGAVRDALIQHPDYLTDKGRKSAVASITKRVTGTLSGHAQQARQGGRLGGSRGSRGCYASPGGAESRPPRSRLPDLVELLIGGSTL